MNVKNLQEGLSGSCLQSDCRLLGWRSILDDRFKCICIHEQWTHGWNSCISAGCSGSQTNSCTLTREGGRAHYLCSRTGVVLQAELVQLLSRLSAPCVTCVIANDKSKLMMLAGAQSESPTLSPASGKLKAQMFGLLNPHTEQQEVKSWDQTTNRPFMNMLDVCPVTVHPGPLTFISNLIALTLHWIVLLLPLFSSLCFRSFTLMCPSIISWESSEKHIKPLVSVTEWI